MTPKPPTHQPSHTNTLSLHLPTYHPSSIMLQFTVSRHSYTPTPDHPHTNAPITHLPIHYPSAIMSLFLTLITYTHSRMNPLSHLLPHFHTWTHLSLSHNHTAIHHPSTVIMLLTVSHTHHSHTHTLINLSPIHPSIHSLIHSHSHSSLSKKRMSSNISKIYRFLIRQMKQILKNSHYHARQLYDVNHAIDCKMECYINVIYSGCFGDKCVFCSQDPIFLWTLM